MNSYYFILGRENKISQKEIECTLASFDFGLKDEDISIITEEILEIKLNADPDQISELMNNLGGTVKIYRKIAPAGTKIIDLFTGENICKKTLFAISNYTGQKVDTFKLALSTKKESKLSLRVIAGKEDDKLSSAQSFQYKMAENLEYGLFKTGVGKLIAVQNINEWSKHDYGKPRSDAISGMLPPKLARMMINIAVGYSGVKNPLVVDPFCGSGNVLIEALSIGCNVIGSDISEKAVEDTKVNLEWLTSGEKWQVTKKDATKYDFGDIKQDFIIVSEPYLGQPRKSKLRIEEENIIKKEIGQLYKDFLTNLSKTTNSSSFKTAALVFPLFELANGKKLSIFNECVDFMNEIGYTTICSPLVYGRDYQIVKREIVLLKLKS